MKAPTPPGKATPVVGASPRPGARSHSWAFQPGLRALRAPLRDGCWVWRKPGHCPPRRASNPGEPRLPAYGPRGWPSASVTVELRGRASNGAQAPNSKPPLQGSKPPKGFGVQLLPSLGSLAPWRGDGTRRGDDRLGHVDTQSTEDREASGGVGGQSHPHIPTWDKPGSLRPRSRPGREAGCGDTLTP